jgi:hypothetical protein
MQYRYRCYSARLGRFASTDPEEFADSPSRYGYVTGRPTWAIDPEGLKTLSCCGKWMKGYELSNVTAGECLRNTYCYLCGDPGAAAAKGLVGVGIGFILAKKFPVAGAVLAVGSVFQQLDCFGMATKLCMCEWCVDSRTPSKRLVWKWLPPRLVVEEFCVRGDLYDRDQLFHRCP